METLKLLVKQHYDSGRFDVRAHVNLNGDRYFEVINTTSGATVYAPLQLEDAVIVAGLCNLTRDPDWSTLQPYLNELAPHIQLKPEGVQ